VADAVLKIGAVVDKEAIVTGMSDGGDAVNAGTTRMTMYFNSLQSAASGAFKKISEDTKAAAGTVSSESLRIAEASRALAAAKKEEAAATRLASNATVDQAQALPLLAAAQANARMQTMALKQAQDALAGASHHVVPEMAASSAAIRSFEGNVPIRAIERFVGTTLGLGPILTAAFPIIGAVDLGIMVGRVGVALYDCAQQALHAGSAINEAFGNLHDKAQLTNDDLRIQDDKLKDEIARISGHPGNGLQTALDEAIKRADQLLLSLKADEKAISEIFKANSVGMGASLLSGVAGTGAQQAQVEGDGKALTEAVRKANSDYAAALLEAKTPAAQKAAGERQAAAIKAAFQSQISTYQAEAARLKKEQADSEADAAAAEKDGNVAVNPVNNSAKIANMQGVIQTLQDRLQQEQLGQKLAADSETLGQAKQDKPNTGADNKAAEARLRAMEEEREKEEQEGKLGAAADYNFWIQRVNAFKKGSEEYHAIQEKVTRADIEMAKAAHEAIAKYKESEKRESGQDVADQERVAKSIAEMNKRLVEQAEDVTRTGERWDGYNRAVAKGSEIAAAQNQAMQEAKLKIAEARGQITPLAAAQAQARIHTDEHTRALQALEAELAKLQAVANSGPKNAATGQAIVDPKVATEMQNLQNQIAQAKGAAATQGVQDSASISAAISKPYMDAFSQINTGWLKVQGDLIAGNAHIGRDFLQMGVHMVQSMAANFEKMLAQQLQFELRKVLLHRTAAAQNNATDVAGAAQSDSVSAISSLKQAGHAASVAAAKAWQAMAGIPIIGPELGAVAAAATYAGVMALAAFEKGGIVGGSTGMGVPILAHAGERVLTTQQTTNFERMVNTSSRGGDTNINFNGSHTFGGGNQGDFRSQVKQHRMALRDEIRSLKREGHLNFA
jgi:hypothetical protein